LDQKQPFKKRLSQKQPFWKRLDQKQPFISEAIRKRLSQKQPFISEAIRTKNKTTFYQRSKLDQKGNALNYVNANVISDAFEMKYIFLS
jgi:primosomal protein N'